MALEMRLRPLALLIAMLIVGGAIATPPTGALESSPVTPLNPLKGWVDQGATPVPLGYAGGACAGTGVGPHGEPVCFDIGVSALDVQPIALLTPGSIHVRISMPVRFINAAQRASGRTAAMQGTIKQTTSTEAIISFPGKLVSRSLVDIDVNFNGQNFTFVFENATGLETERTVVMGRHVSVYLQAEVPGKLVIKIFHPGGSLAAVTSRRMTSVGKRVVHLTLHKPFSRNLASHCRIIVTLKNGLGSEQVRGFLGESILQPIG